MIKQINSKYAIALIIVLAAVVASCATFEYKFLDTNFLSWIFECKDCRPDPSPPPKVEGIEQFSSEEDFLAYLEKAAELDTYYLSRGIEFMNQTFAEDDIGIAVPMEAGKGGGEIERVSETTVQVKGIDEPDIVKTDGENIYFSSTEYYWRWGWGTEMVIPRRMTGEIKTIKAFPPADLEVEGEIDEVGNLLLHEDTLVVFAGDKIYGYDVSNVESPKKEWTTEISNRSVVTGARLYDGKIYLITKTGIDRARPCPIKPLSVDGASVEVMCTDIYYPVTPVAVDVTYNAMVIDPSSGEVEKKVSFVGSSNYSVVYMSENGIYVTYYYQGDFIKFYSDFFTEECKDIIPDWLIDKVEKLAGYDIGNSAKMTEFQELLGQYYNSLDDDERLRVNNELTNRMSDYYKDHKRDLEKTGIVKIGLEEFVVTASGEVPGKPLNQFSLDEYDNHLRIAVTIGERFFGMIGGVRESANDVYVLDQYLDVTGSVKDLGLDERIYSARFIGDKGYVVTFRQIDPFYVLDLSDPNNPELKGELKIPGYSSYLHPITEDKILGIGKEESQVKISLFDVESPENPKEISKYNLDEYWSDILNTHHAFLLDSKHEIFFLPGSKGGYVFSYEGNGLKLARAVSGISARRAIYINDYLYIIGDDQITVLNEIDWEEVNELEL